jgi:hypothetical protein
MFERLSKPAKNAITAACAEAARRGDRLTDDVHLLIGCSMVRSDTSSMLKDAGATRSRIIEVLDGLDNEGFNEDDVRALAMVGVNFEAIARAAEDVFGKGALDAGPRSRLRGPTKRAARLGPSGKQAVAQALSETINADARRIGVEHLVLGVLHDPSPRCRAVTVMLDLDYDSVRARLAERSG